MAGERRLVTAGVVGRPHGLDGSFHVERPADPLAPGTVVWLEGRARTVERRAGIFKEALGAFAGIARQLASPLKDRVGAFADLAHRAIGSLFLAGCGLRGFDRCRRFLSPDHRFLFLAACRKRQQ